MSLARARKMVCSTLLATFGGAEAVAQTSPLPGKAATSRDAEISERYRRLEADVDGWESEVFQDAAGAQLGKLGTLVEHPADIDAQHVAKLASPAYRSRAVWPQALERAWSDASALVERGSPTDETFEGHEGFARALEHLATGFDGAVEAYVKFKIVDVQVQGETATTRALLSANARHAGSSLLRSATWDVTWRRGVEGAPPLVLSIDVAGCEEVRTAPGTAALFEDVTEAVVGSTAAWRDQLRLGVNNWCAQLDVQLGISSIGHEGFALGDADGDGREDLYLCAPGGLPNRLLLSSADGTLRDAPEGSGVDFLDASRAALFCDLDADADQDLVVTVAEELLFLANDGQAQFELRARVPAAASSSLAIADVDQDGDLDVYVCAYMQPDSEDRVPIPYHDANNGFRNTLWEQVGEWSFADRTRERGLDRNNRRFSFAAAFEDYDDDGDQDLYVANDFGRNNLYRNDGGTFVDVAAQAGVEDIAASMGVTWGDYDLDGRIDLYVSNMFSSAGERVTGQTRFKPDVAPGERSLFRRHARGNSLFKNKGDGTFEDVSVEANVVMGRWAWGALFVDVNNDGREDLFSPNGFVTEENTKDL